MTHSSRFLPFLVAAAIVVGALLALGAPLASLLPFALVLACPIVMFFMMKGMAGTHGRR